MENPYWESFAHGVDETGSGVVDVHSPAASASTVHLGEGGGSRVCDMAENKTYNERMPGQGSYLRLQDDLEQLWQDHGGHMRHLVIRHVVTKLWAGRPTADINRGVWAI